MSASQQHHDALPGFKEERLVVHQRIGPSGLGVQEKWSSCVFEIRPARHGACYHQSIEHSGRDDRFHQHSTAFVQCPLAGPRNPDLARGAVSVACVLGQSCERVEEHGGPVQAKHLAQAAGVIVVTVAQHDRIRLVQRDIQLESIRRQYLSLPGVEQHSAIFPFDPVGQTMFGEQSRLRGRVLDDDTNSDLFRHSCIAFQRAEGSSWSPALVAQGCASRPHRPFPRRRRLYRGHPGRRKRS